MTLEQAIEKLKEEYEKALKSEYIHSPLAYALYKTWRYVDNREKKKKRKVNQHEGK